MSSPSEPLDPALYESQAGIPIAVVTVTLTIALTAVCLRTYARAVMIRQFGADDWAAVVAVVLAIGSGSMVAANTMYGHGRHLAVVDKSQLWKYFRTFYISIVLYNGSLTATKLTFLLQYYRILGMGHMRTVIIAAFVFVALWSISQLLVVIFTCTPIHKFWLPETPGTCIPNLPFWYYNAAGNIVTDVLIFVLPLPALTRLNLRKGQKLALVGVFCLGFFTCAISVIRIQYLKLSEDVTWDNVASSCWSIGEICSGITCACLPTLRPLLSTLIPSMRSQSDRNENKYYRRASGRDASHGGGSRLKSTDENASSRGIIYPEDVELQSDDRSDKEIRVTVDRLQQHPPPPPPAGSAAVSDHRNGTALSRLQLGLKTTVRTEVKVGSPALETSFPSGDRPGPGGIAVKRDFMLTSGRPSG
ncbi:hypothetical protein N658DRAFT_431713 [Parathielavia hyrcaniae]|uniref:Rhodopsin domain-containing protein n=1 Tax=Parathielavia hyrcaniae TaxID=113614 RepID=A0AAN6PV99_9PEZI|nr:hypothetical protein N658DRAFT_431713 [Parathielavia hyrcaniae]